MRTIAETVKLREVSTTGPAVAAYEPPSPCRTSVGPSWPSVGPMTAEPAGAAGWPPRTSSRRAGPDPADGPAETVPDALGAAVPGAVAAAEGEPAADGAAAEVAGPAGPVAAVGAGGPGGSGRSARAVARIPPTASTPTTAPAIFSRCPRRCRRSLASASAAQSGVAAGAGP
ncbi:hypothetical protein [Kitasatospora paranensis]|uniref:hypothetical protein n=1 Tax=Kitasatospora paranensis TaxID=258053 RepID=UPI0031EE0EA3